MGKAGLEDVVAAESAICDVNGTEGKLVYRGYDIHDLAQHSTFEEVIYLLWYGHLPHKTELESFGKELAGNRALPADIVEMMKKFPFASQPMDLLRTTVSALAMYDPDKEDNSREANIRKAMRLTGQIPTIIAYWDNIRTGKPTLTPKADLNLAANFLYMLKGQIPDELSAKSLDIALILHADHELNASTFAARVAAATLTDMYSATVAAIGTLKGPLHGGANQEVIKLLIKIDSVDKADSYVHHELEAHQKIMGFGHRVYKTEDPRAHDLRNMSEQLSKRNGDNKWYEISRAVEKTVMKEKALHANVDFYSASVYYMLGIPIDLFTPIFAISRMSGWAAHILEQLENNRLIRPRAEYTGEKDLHYSSIDKR